MRNNEWTCYYLQIFYRVARCYHFTILQTMPSIILFWYYDVWVGNVHIYNMQIRCWCQSSSVYRWKSEFSIEIKYKHRLSNGNVIFMIWGLKGLNCQVLADCLGFHLCDSAFQGFFSLPMENTCWSSTSIKKLLAAVPNQG